MIRVDEQYRVRLWLVVQVEANAGVVGADYAGRGRLVSPEPGDEMKMRSTMPANANR